MSFDPQNFDTVDVSDLSTAAPTAAAKVVSNIGALTVEALTNYLRVALALPSGGNVALTASGIFIENEDAVGDAKWHKLRVKSINGVPTLFADETGVSL